jgi:hypothetical protein
MIHDRMRDAQKGQGLPGLEATYNRLVCMLDQILPHPARSDDKLASLLLLAADTLQQEAPHGKQAIDDLFSLCASFRSEQYGRDPDKKFTDHKNRWLPIAIMGEKWSEVVQSLFGFILHPCCQNFDYIILRPGGKGNQAEIEVELRPEVSHIDQERYEKFERLVKNPHGVRSVYHVDEGKLVFPEHTRIYEDCAQINVLSGGMPSWVESLSSWNAIQGVTVRFPVRDIHLPELGDIVAASVIVPCCPVAWRSSVPTSQARAMSALRSWLDVGSSPFYFLLTKALDEWIPLLDTFVGEIVKARFGGETLDNQDLLDDDVLGYRLQRRLGIGPSQIVRADCEFDYFRNHVCISADSPESEDICIRSGLLLPDGDGIGGIMAARIGDARYVISVLRSACSVCESALDKIRKSSMLPGEPAGRAAVSGGVFQSLLSKQLTANKFERTPVHSSSQLAELIVEVLLKGLQNNLMVAEYEVEERQSRHEKKWSWLSHRMEEDTDLTLPIRHLVKTVTKSQKENQRVVALSALLYLWDHYDIVSDDVEHGLLDDRFALAEAIRKLEKHEKTDTTSVSAWALKVQSAADAELGSYIQKRIRMELNVYLAELEGI